MEWQFRKQLTRAKVPLILRSLPPGERYFLNQGVTYTLKKAYFLFASLLLVCDDDVNDGTNSSSRSF